MELPPIWPWEPGSQREGLGTRTGEHTVERSAYRVPYERFPLLGGTIEELGPDDNRSGFPHDDPIRNIWPARGGAAFQGLSRRMTSREKCSPLAG